MSALVKYQGSENAGQLAHIKKPFSQVSEIGLLALVIMGGFGWALVVVFVFTLLGLGNFFCCLGFMPIGLVVGNAIRAIENEQRKRHEAVIFREGQYALDVSRDGTLLIDRATYRRWRSIPHHLEGFLTETNRIHLCYPWTGDPPPAEYDQALPIEMEMVEILRTSCAPRKLYFFPALRPVAERLRLRLLGGELSCVLIELPPPST